MTLTASDKDADLFALEADAVVYYGSEIPLGWDGVCLFEETWLPLAAADNSDLGRNLGRATLLDFEKLTPKWINWRDFADLTGHAEIATATSVNLGSYGSTLDAAIRGRGIALGCPDILQIEIRGQPPCSPSRLRTSNRPKLFRYLALRNDFQSDPRPPARIGDTSMTNPRRATLYECHWQ